MNVCARGRRGEKVKEDEREKRGEEIHHHGQTASVIERPENDSSANKIQRDHPGAAKQR